MRPQPLLIDGEWVASSDGATFEVTNPATEQLIARVALATAEDVKEAVAAADRAFPAWARLSPAERATHLHQAADLAEERHEEIGRTLTEEQGKPLSEGMAEARRGAAALRYYAEEGQRAYGRVIAGAAADHESRVIYQPVGPAAGISPWNYPVSLLAYKAGAALAAGCTFVSKPPSLTPLSPLAFLRCLTDAGVPDGVVNAPSRRSRFCGASRTPVFQMASSTPFPGRARPWAGG
jgi:succinate-semialdehyde dehydrogenase/glutarate-semialdehyde dehydrogenase